MGADVWLQALFLQPPKICGKQLLPFSVGHYFLLRNLNSPYIKGGIPTYNDLLMAILICSMSFETCQKILVYNPKMWKWSLWFLRWQLINLETAEKSLKQYLSEYICTPEHWEYVKGEDIKPVDPYGCPLEFHIVRVLCSIYNMNTEKAWNTPYGLARCYYDTWAESDRGDISVISEHQFNLIKGGKA